MPEYNLSITATGHDRASGVFGKLADSMRRVFEVAGGILASRLVVGIADQVRQFASASFDAVAQMQSMRVSLESLASRELVQASGGIKTISEVSGQASVMAGKMMDELSRIAILSPYTVAAVQSTFKLNMAFGYTSDQAAKLTKGMLNMAAGVGADNEQLNRMAYNFAQIRLQGKVTAMDVRQLAMAGFDLEGALKDVSAQFGFTIKDHTEFNDLIAKGKISWEQFTEGFSKYAEKNFGGASEKMSRTLMGLKSTFSDIFILTMPKLLGPSAEKITGFLSEILDLFLKISDSGVLETIGVKWAASVDTFLGRAREVMGKVFKGDFGGALKSIGVPKPILDFFDDIIASIDNLKIFWKANGPEIKNIFKELISGVLGFTGDKVTQGLDSTGGFFESFTQRLIDNGPKIVENFGKIKDYILNEVLPAVDSFIDKLINEWIPKAIEFGTYLKDNWQPILKNVAAVVLAVAGALAALSALKGAASIILGVGLGVGRLVAAVGAAGGISSFMAMIAGGLQFLLPILGTVFSTLLVVVVSVTAALAALAAIAFVVWKNWDKIKPVFDAVYNSLKTSLSPVFEQLVTAFGPLKSAAGELLKALQPIGQLLLTVLVPVLKVLGGIIGIMLLNIIATVTGIITGLVQLITSAMQTGANIIQSIAMIIQGVVNFITGLFNLIVGAFTGNGEKMKAAWDQIWLGLQQVVGGAIALILNIIIGNLNMVLQFFSGFGVGVMSVMKAFWDGLAASTTGWVSNFAKTISNAIANTITAVRKLGTSFSSVGKAIVDGIKTGITNGWSNLLEWFKDLLHQLVSGAQTALDIHSPSRPFIYMGKMITAGVRVGVAGLPALLDTSVLNPLRNLPTRAGTNNYTNASTQYYAPVYNVYKKDPERVSAVSVG